MIELVHERDLTITTNDGVVFDRIRVYAEPHSAGQWAGVIEFLSADGTRVLRTERETTQNKVADVAYWATGLELVYFEGALDRARRRRNGSASPDAGPGAGWRVAFVEIVGADPELPLRVMNTRTLAPGWRRPVHEGGVLVYEGTLKPPTATEAGRYAFLVLFRTENAAALVANAVWSELHQAVAAVIVEGTPVPMNHGAIKEALLRTAQAVENAA